MAYTPELQKIFDEIKALPPATARPIDIPIRPFFQIASQIIESGKREIVELKKYNYNESKFARMELLIAVLRELSGSFNDVQFDQPEFLGVFLKLREEAELLRFEMLSALELLGRDDLLLLTKIGKIHEGSSHSDLIQDLTDAKIICESQIEKLKNINFDPSILDRVPELSSQLSSLLAKATMDKSLSSELRLERDKAYTLLRDLLQELVSTARYAFRNDPARGSKFSLSYSPIKRKVKAEEKTYCP